LLTHPLFPVELEESWKSSKYSRRIGKKEFEKKDLSEFDFKIKNKPNAFEQLGLLTKRSMVDFLREPLKIRATIGRDLFLSILIGLIYLRLDSSQGAILSRSGALFFWFTVVLMGSIMSQVNTFPQDKNVFFREHSNNLYGVAPYYLSKLISDLPFQLLTCCISSTIAYWMIGFESDADKFGIFLLLNMFVGLIGGSWGVFLGTLAKDSTVAVALVPVTTLPFLVFSGFLLNDDTIEWYLKWFNYLSFQRYALRAAMYNEFKDRTFDLLPDGTGIPNGQAYLATLSMDDVDVGITLLILTAIYVTMRLLAAGSLALVTKKHKTNA